MTRLTTASFLALALSLSGCASFNGDKPGSSDFSCPGRPDGATCMDPIEVYERTHDSDSVAPNTQASAGAGGGSGSKRQGADVPVVVQRNLIVNPPSPKPILEEAQVMRVWVAPFVDANQDLQWPGHIFTEVTPRRWSFGERDVENIRNVVPLQVSAAEPSAENAPLPGSRAPDYEPGLPPNPAGAIESIPPGPAYMRDEGPDLDDKPYAPAGSSIDYN